MIKTLMIIAHMTNVDIAGGLTFTSQIVTLNECYAVKYAMAGSGNFWTVYCYPMETKP